MIFTVLTESQFPHLAQILLNF